MKKILTLFVLLLMVSGCGYRPSAKFASSVVGESISTNVIISREDPRNSVIIKDAISAAILERFKSKIAPKGSATTHLDVVLEGYTLTPQQYDKYGYVVLERATVRLLITRVRGDEKKTYKTYGVHDFTVEPNSIVTDDLRFSAIREGAAKAIDSFIAKVSAEGVLKGK